MAASTYSPWIPLLDDSIPSLDDSTTMANSNIILLTIVSLCVSLATAHHPSYAKRNLDTITKIYARTVYPTNLEFIQRGPASVPPGLFAANARGRVTPLGNFTGFEDSTEYFFALAPVPTPPAYVAISKAEITHFSSQCPEVAASVVYLRTSVFHPGAPNDGKYSSTLKQVSNVSFRKNGIKKPPPT